MNRPFAAALLLSLPLVASSPLAPKDDLQDLTFVVREQNLRLEAAEAEIATLHARLAELTRAGQSLSSAVQTSRTNGFESAGPNPQAKTDLLEGLLQLGAELARPVRAPDEKGVGGPGEVGG